MTEQVVIVVIGVAQTIILALIGRVAIFLQEVRKEVGKVKLDAAAARSHSAGAHYQVENDHTENLREESDFRHAEMKTWIDDLR